MRIPTFDRALAVVGLAIACGVVPQTARAQFPKIFTDAKKKVEDARNALKCVTGDKACADSAKIKAAREADSVKRAATASVGATTTAEPAKGTATPATTPQQQGASAASGASTTSAPAAPSLPADANAVVLHPASASFREIRLPTFKGLPRVGEADTYHGDDHRYTDTWSYEQRNQVTTRIQSDKTELSTWGQALVVWANLDQYPLMDREKITVAITRSGYGTKVKPTADEQAAQERSQLGVAQQGSIELLAWMSVSALGREKYFCTKQPCTGRFGSGDEFARTAAYRQFAKEDLDKVLQWATSLPREAYAVGEGHIEGQYDFANQSFVLVLPGPQLMGTRPVQAAYGGADQPKQSFLYTWKISPDEAKALGDRTNRRFKAVYRVAFDAAPTARRPNDLKEVRYHFVSNVVELYEDEGLTKHIVDVTLPELSTTSTSSAPPTSPSSPRPSPATAQSHATPSGSVPPASATSSAPAAASATLASAGSILPMGSLASADPNFRTITLPMFEGLPRLGAQEDDGLSSAMRGNANAQQIKALTDRANARARDLQSYASLLELKFSLPIYPAAKDMKLDPQRSSDLAGDRAEFARKHLPSVALELSSEAGFNKYFCANRTTCAATKSQLLEGQPTWRGTVASTGATWGGLGADEFGVNAAFTAFMKDSYPELQRLARAAGTAAYCVTRVQLSEYDFAKKKYTGRLSVSTVIPARDAIFWRQPAVQSHSVLQMSFDLPMDEAGAQALRAKAQSFYAVYKINFAGAGDQVNPQPTASLGYQLVDGRVRLYSDDALTQLVAESALKWP